MLKLAIILSVAACCVHARNSYYLYTRKNPTVPEKIGENYNDHYDLYLWNSAYFNESDNTIILIHGHGGSPRTPFVSLITDNILKYEEPHNIIVVDWQNEASNTYSIASANVPYVAIELAYFMWENHDYLHFPKLHLIGFGLGAHVAGIACRWAYKMDGYYEYPVGRITGLDPSGSGWGANTQRLRSTDAEYVEVIHTDGSGLLSNGIGTAIGDVNFYVNGGSNQPGCLTNSCSHNRAYELCAASFVNPHLVGHPCSSTAQMNLNRCGGTPLKICGTEIYKRSSSSIYRISTNRNYPF